MYKQNENGGGSGGGWCRNIKITHLIAHNGKLVAVANGQVLECASVSELNNRLSDMRRGFLELTIGDKDNV